MNRITTVIFDMYETLVENGPHLWQATFDVIVADQHLDTTGERLWLEWRSRDQEFRNRRINPCTPFQTYYEAWRDCFALAFQELGLKGDADAACRKSILDMSRRRPYAETIEALGLIQAQWRTAILSNADDDYLLPNIRLLEVDFQAVLSSEEVRSYKPQPALFQELLRRMGVAPEETVYVGDRQFEDVQGAGGVNMRTIWINRSGTAPDPKLPKPDFQITSLLEIPKLLSGRPASKEGT